MQIHELTYKRRIDEVSLGGVLSGVKTAGKALGAVATGIGKEALGLDAGSVNAPGTSVEQSKALAAPMIRTQAEANLKVWNQLLSQQMSAQGVTALNQLDSTSVDQMKSSLQQQISKNFLRNRAGNDYSKLPELVDPTHQAEAASAVRQLNDAVAKITNFTSNSKTPSQSLAEWTELTTAAFDAMRLLQFYPAAGSKQAAAPVVTPSPKAQALANAIGLDQDGIEKLNYAITQAGEKINDAGTGSQSLDELLKAARLLR